MDLKFVQKTEFDRALAGGLTLKDRLALVADMCRLNALTVVKRAGSGHLGSSFSSMEIMVLLYFHLMNVKELGLKNPDRDIFFSSKGHDVPALYSVLYAMGLLAEEKFINLRRISGVEGHPDVKTPGMEVCSGSLGMGISKAHGMVLAKKKLGLGGNVYVLTGDGELQEGQNYEALQHIAHRKSGRILVIVDHNKVQSDRYVESIASLGDLSAKLSSFGWNVLRCDGNSMDALMDVFDGLKLNSSAPNLLIADTVKGRGVSFMEHTQAMPDGSYPWHSGAPKDEDYMRAVQELVAKISAGYEKAGLGHPAIKALAPAPAHSASYSLQGEPVSLKMPPDKVTKRDSEFVAQAYGEELVEIAGSRKDIVVLDADLAADCRVRAFELKYPDRFIECGIAEQDMVSVAGGLARQGLLPVVNSFASFLASRANEQIYNNACEGSKIIYACHYAGLIPAGPGKSHQSIRDISLLGALPNVEIIQPCNNQEARLFVRYAVYDSDVNVALRLIIGPSPRKIDLPADYIVKKGCGVELANGGDAILFAYGPVMLHEALIASELLATRSIGLTVVNMPWLNRVDADWLRRAVSGYRYMFVVEDHAPVGGLADRLLECMQNVGISSQVVFSKFAVEGFPAFGTPWEALACHGLDGQSLASRILKEVRR